MVPYKRRITLPNTSSHTGPHTDRTVRPGCWSLCSMSNGPNDNWWTIHVILVHLCETTPRFLQGVGSTHTMCHHWPIESSPESMVEPRCEKTTKLIDQDTLDTSSLPISSVCLITKRNWSRCMVFPTEQMSLIARVHASFTYFADPSLCSLFSCFHDQIYQKQKKELKGKPVQTCFSRRLYPIPLLCYFTAYRCMRPYTVKMLVYFSDCTDRIVLLCHL